MVDRGVGQRFLVFMLCDDFMFERRKRFFGGTTQKGRKKKHFFCLLLISVGSAVIHIVGMVLT